MPDTDLERLRASVARLLADAHRPPRDRLARTLTAHPVGPGPVPPAFVRRVARDLDAGLVEAYGRRPADVPAAPVGLALAAVKGLAYARAAARIRPLSPPATDWHARAADGETLAGRVIGARDDARRRSLALLESLAGLGATARDLIDRLRAFLSPAGLDRPGPSGARGLDRAATLLVTEITISHSAGLDDAAAAGGVALVWEVSVFHRGLDECDRAAREDRYGLGPGAYPAGVGPRPPLHPRCLTPGTLVTARDIVAAAARPYEGEVVVIETGRGHRLTVTPNHPILTPAGWIGAGRLGEGDQVISDGRHESMPVLNADDEHAPARIEEIVEAFASASGMAPRVVPTTAVDFHGDGVEGEVCIVWADRLLDRGGDAAFAQPTREQLLIGRAGLPALLAADRLIDSGFERLPLAANGIMGGGSYPLPFVGGQAGHAQRLSLLRATDGDTGLMESAHDDRTRHPEPPREIEHGFPAFVGSDEIRHIDREPFHGLVYNLQTQSGWYIANGIITHNCRCSMRPATTRA